MIASRHLLVALGLAVAPLGASGAALADRPPVRIGAASAGLAPTPAVRSGGARDYFYQDGAVYAVTAKPGHITDIVLQPGERLAGPIAAGDTARWVIGDTISGDGETQRVHVMLKPTEAGLVTNLIINTDRRSYRLDLRSTSQAWNSYVTWRYPVTPLAIPPMPDTKAPSSPSDAVTQLNFNYSIRGPRTPWRPLRVFNDGARTYVEFAPTIAMTELPPLFGLSTDGKASELINYRVSGQRLVIDRVVDRVELRLGQGRSERRVQILLEAAR